MGINCLFNRVPLLDWEGVISGEAFFLEGLWGTAGGVQAVQSMPNLKKGSAAVWFREIKRVINLIGGAEDQHSVKLSFDSGVLLCICGSYPKAKIHNEPAQRTNKEPHAI